LSWLKAIPTCHYLILNRMEISLSEKVLRNPKKLLFNRWITQLAVSIFSGMALFAAFPPYSYSYLVWIGMAPFLLFLVGRKPFAAFLLSWIWGCTFFLGIFTWILNVVNYTYLHHAILIVYLGAYFAVFGLIFNIAARSRGMLSASVAAPFIWIALEYMRSNLSFMALPWGLLAHSQHQNHLIIQIAAIAGTHGVSMLIVAANVGLAMMIGCWMFRLNLLKETKLPKLTRKTTITFSAAVVALLIMSIAYGYSVISRPIEGRRIKVAVVQGNIEQWQKWDKKFAPLIMRTYKDLTLAAALDTPDFIIWPETATPKAINTDQQLFKEIREVAELAGTYLLLGSSQVYKFKKNDPKSAKVKNSAYLVPPDPQLKLNQRYDKILLFPFGEYLPYKKTIPWDYISVPDVGNYIRGKELVIFKLSDFQFSVTICWENLFSDFVRQFVKAGAQFIVNMTNEAWFGPSGAPYQFVSMNVFRAVENRVFVIRCTNTGISCFIDPNGRILNSVKDDNGKEVFIRGTASSEIVANNSSTLYTQFGDWLAWISVLLSVSFLLFSIAKRKTRHLSDANIS